MTPHRRFAYTTVSLEDAKTIRRAFGCTFNDVVMALCSGTLRRYLQAHDCLPTEPLIAMVPVSVRTGAEEDTFQNRVSGLLADLATNEADPVDRIRRVQASMTRAKEDFKAIPAETLQDYGQFTPPALAARAMRMYSRLRIADRMNPPFNLIISNVPGPAAPLYSGGARLKHFYPVSAVSDGQGLNMTVQSYNGNLDFGFISCRELVPDLWTMVDYLQESMTELLEAAAAVSGEAPAPSAAKKAPARKRAPAKKAPAAKKVASAKKVTARKGASARKSPAGTAAAKQTPTRRTPTTKRAATKRAATKRRRRQHRPPPDERQLTLSRLDREDPGQGATGMPAARSAAMRSATITVGSIVLARGTIGITEASHTTSPSMPITRQRGSTTASRSSGEPIRQVPAAWT